MFEEPLPVETSILLLPENDEGFIVGVSQLADESYRYDIATYGPQGYLDGLPIERLKVIGLPVITE